MCLEYVVTPPGRRVNRVISGGSGDVGAAPYVSAMTATEVTYAYRVPSRMRRISERSELLLGTSGGRTETGPAASPYLTRLAAAARQISPRP
jgi:hypothetical protein